MEPYITSLLIWRSYNLQRHAKLKATRTHINITLMDLTQAPSQWLAPIAAGAAYQQSGVQDSLSACRSSVQSKYFFKGGEGEMELPLHMLPLCCHSLTTGYFHHIVVLSGLVELPKPKLGKSVRDTPS
jgi:hypothetical protein